MARDQSARHLARLADEERRTADDANGVRLEHEAAEAAIADIQQSQQDAEQAIDAAREAERAAADLNTARISLAERADEAVIAASSIPDLQVQIQRQTRIAGEAEDNVQRLVRAAGDLRVQAETARNAAAQLRQEMSEVESTSARPANERPSGSIPQLRSTYASAHGLYLAAAPDDELKKQADETARHAQKLRDGLKQHDAAHVALATRLLAGPDGSGQAAWERAAERARRRADRLREDDREINQRIGKKRQEVSAASRGGAEGPAGSWTSLPVELQPAGVEHGRDLLEQAHVKQQGLQARVETALASRDSLGHQQQQATSRFMEFRQAHLPLHAVLSSNEDPAASPSVRADGRGIESEPADVATYDGSAAAAAEAAAAATETLARTAHEEARTDRVVTRQHEELVIFVRDDAYNKLRAPVRSLIIGSSRGRVAGNAAEWSSQLMARRVSLQQDLDNVDKHRATIVDRLAALVDRAIKTLRLAARLSRLPETLGDWSGREFLHFAFSQPDLTAISTRVGDVVDDEAAAVSGRGATIRAGRAGGRRDGMGLLLKAVHAAVPRGFAVTILKPDQVLRDERVPVEEMSDVFSGGQELTAAIMLYCTLAAVKANERGQMRVRHSGVLFLDNPIGKASARYLLDMQKQVAAALGVQLVYTTGLSDDRALAAFPLWIRMRNDADLRAGLKHIRVSDTVRAVLPDPYDDTDTIEQPGTVTAARISRRLHSDPSS